MHGLMMNEPLLISSIAEHAEKFHGDQEIVSVTVDNPQHRCTFRDALGRSRQLANALARLGLEQGDRVATLNGVKEPIELIWPDGLAYSPITGTQTDPDGLQWYVHADGSRSTTQMVWRSDLGRKVAMAVVANPKEPIPMKGAAEEEAEAKKKGARGKQ